MIDNTRPLNSACCRQDVRVKFSAYHGRQGEQFPALLIEQGQPLGYDRADSLRKNFDVTSAFLLRPPCGPPPKTRAETDHLHQQRPRHRVRGHLTISPRLRRTAGEPERLQPHLFLRNLPGAHVKVPSRVWRYVSRWPAPTRDRVVASAGGWRSGEDSPRGRLGDATEKDHGMMRIRPVPYVVAVLLSTAAIGAFLIGWRWLAN